MHVRHEARSVHWVLISSTNFLKFNIILLILKNLFIN